ncbi:PTS sugar transporter subunit IIC [Schleiferilactobacillus perolens]|uniref:Permease IIC component n=1 Tax=Schleiferilactobacillus perolens DSM 12744 TaxID=1423792 RepID=A0A0R1N841_9LACO|nr:PTS transporter subunit EIIC [Schleiferilactobacillus perolens]KRL14500.1 phosphotransferase system enzyme IIC permease component [Schleiferilactobacillus perolens DSM 12744]
MKALQGFMEKHFIPVATRISANKWIQSISRGTMSLMGIIIVGAIFSLLNSIGIPAYQTFLKGTGLANFLSFVPAVTINAIALYMVFLIAYQAAHMFGKPELGVNVGVIALVSFLTLVPLQIKTPKGALQAITSMNVDYIGSRGAFTAIITAMIVTTVYLWIVKKNWVIHMPDGVPSQVSKSFTDIIPAFVILALFALIRWGFSATSYVSATDFIYKILQTPIENLTGSLPSFIILIILAQLLWFFGIHGSFTILPILMPIWIGYINSNMAAYHAGRPIPHMFNIEMYNMLAIGGAGGTLGFVIVMLLFAKSQQYKKMARLVILPGLFNINEPLIFGLPIILNPVLFIPFVFTPVLILLLGYALMVTGIVGVPIGLFLPASTPIVISGIMQGSWTYAVWQVVAVLISCLTYYPFFKILDKTALEDETNAALLKEAD